MNKRNLVIAGGAAALSLALIALPGTPAETQEQKDARIARLQRQIEELKAQLAGPRAFVVEDEPIGQLQQPPRIETDELNFVMDGEGSSWLGVETREVTADVAKELKLPGEHGVVLGKIIPDGPAA